MATLAEIEGIGPTYAQKLKDAGIDTIEDLLEKGASPGGRDTIAEKTAISVKLILEWVNLADLFRIKGIGEEISDLLEEAGVDTVPELATRNAESLHEKLTAINEQQNLVRRLPTVDQVKEWIDQAKQLPRIITH